MIQTTIRSSENFDQTTIRSSENFDQTTIRSSENFGGNPCQPWAPSPANDLNNNVAGHTLMFVEYPLKINSQISAEKVVCHKI